MGRHIKNKYALHKRIPIEINWKSMIVEILLKNRSRRLSAPEITDAIMQRRPIAIRGMSREVIQTRIASSHRSMELSGNVKVYPVAKGEK